MFDSLSRQMAGENAIQINIKNLITKKEFIGATKLIDSLLKENPGKGIYYTYKGIVYAERGMYTEALGQYDKSILFSKTDFPLVLSKKGEIFIRNKKYDLAILNYKKAALLNRDFNFEVAQSFELAEKMDSALKYYKMYFNNYPNDKRVNDKIQSLSH
jgi:tetratricopeptide (TPR) repeat protein